MELFDLIKGMGIDPIIVVLIIAGGFASKAYLASLTNIQLGKFNFKVTDAWKTLLTGTLFTTIYILILKSTGELEKNMLKSFFYSYVFATSFYELLIGPITKWIGNKFKDNTPN